MLLCGGGAGSLQDRGALAGASPRARHPYFNANCTARWQEYVRWYMTAWEARKIIDIPVDDALRKPVELLGLAPQDECALRAAWDEFQLSACLRRALIQERLLGGCLLLPIFLRPASEPSSSPLDLTSICPGDLQGVNVVDISRLSRPAPDPDPFSPAYGRPEHILVNNTALHISRCVLLEGDALFAQPAQPLLESLRANPAGFGESKLAPLYDLLVRVVGTQQGAYHLVNMASCLLIEADSLRSVLAAESPAAAKLQEIIEQLSIYRGAVIDAKGAKIAQHSANFGSVPELVMTFAQLLSAASDIPASRFLGQAPGGLNTTGEGDQNNYYDMVAAYQRLKLMPVQRRCLDWLGAHLWGWQLWQEKSARLELEYPDLKTMNDKEKAEIAADWAGLLRSLCESGLISPETAAAELNARKIMKLELPPPDPGNEEEEE